MFGELFAFARHTVTQGLLALGLTDTDTGPTLKHLGTSLRRTAEMLRSWLGHQERWQAWRPLDRSGAERCYLAAGTVHRWLDGAGKVAQASVAGQLSGIGQTQAVGTDGLWAKLKGQAQRVVLLVVDSVSGLVYPPIVAKGEGSEGPWQRLFERAQQAGLDLDALRGVTSDGALAHASRLGWHWRIRVKGCFVVYRGGRRRLRLSNLAVEAGHAHFWQHVRITDQRYGPVYLALAHLAENGERWLVVSDEPTSLATLDEYGLRFDIEENFLDDKSNGFQLESSWIRSADALTRLGLVLAATTLYLVAQGTEVVRQNKRREPGPKLKVVFVNYAKA